MRRAIGAACILVACGAPLACEAPGANFHRLESPRAIVWLASLPPEPGIGSEFSLDLKVCGKGGLQPQQVQVDAWMPAHRHGMNTRTVVTPGPAGRYRVDGLLFHMPGRWAIRVEVDTAGGRERLALERDVAD